MKKKYKIFEQKIFEKRRQKIAPSSFIFVYFPISSQIFANIRKSSSISGHLRKYSPIFAPITPKICEYLRRYPGTPLLLSRTSSRLQTWFFRSFSQHFASSWEINFFPELFSAVKIGLSTKNPRRFFDKVAMISCLIIWDDKSRWFFDKVAIFLDGVLKFTNHSRWMYSDDLRSDSNAFSDPR